MPMPNYLVDTETEHDLSLPPPEALSTDIDLRHILEERLLQCGWRRDIEQMIRDRVRARGVSNLSRNVLTKEVESEAHGLVPVTVRDEIVRRSRETIDPPMPSDIGRRPAH